MSTYEEIPHNNKQNSSTIYLISNNKIIISVLNFKLLYLTIELKYC